MTPLKKYLYFQNLDIKALLSSDVTIKYLKTKLFSLFVYWNSLTKYSRLVSNFQPSYLVLQLK